MSPCWLHSKQSSTGDLFRVWFRYYSMENNIYIVCSDSELWDHSSRVKFFAVKSQVKRLRDVQDPCFVHVRRMYVIFVEHSTKRAKFIIFNWTNFCTLRCSPYIECLWIEEYMKDLLPTIKIYSEKRIYVLKYTI